MQITLYPYERFCTWPRFEKESKSNSEMGYCLGQHLFIYLFIYLLIIQFECRIYKDAPAPQVVITNLGGAGEREKNETASAKKKSDRKANTYKYCRA